MAFSGGADSTALLVACQQKWPGQVGAIHIHHGLQAAADDFQRHCERMCTYLEVPLVVRRVKASADAGQSPEDAARRARYRAFAELAVEGWPAWDAKFDTHPRTLLLAQHADDQVETVLLALGRGAGLPGLAAMPRQWRRDGIEFHRPLLGVSAGDIRNWLLLQPADFIDDPSNGDLRFTRNQIRAQIMPALQAVLPSVRDTFARSASHAAQAQALLRELGADDLMQTEDASAEGLVIKKLQALSPARQANLLRHWFKTRFATQASAAQLHELLDQLAACTTRGHKINMRLGAGFTARQNEILTWYNS